MRRAAKVDGTMSTYEALTGEHEMVLAADSEAGKCLLARIVAHDGGVMSSYLVRSEHGESEYFSLGGPDMSLFRACEEYDRA